MTPEFQEATLYTCGDYHHGPIHTSPEAAIRERLESDWERDETTAEQCERLGDLLVLGHKPEPILPSWIDARVEETMELFEQSFEEEYCNDSGDGAQAWTGDTREWFKKVFTANLNKSLRSAIVKDTRKSGSQTFTVAQCIKMLK